MLLNACLLSLWQKIQFRPPLWAIFFNPFFVIRRGLYQEIRAVAGTVRGRMMDFGAGQCPYRELFSVDDYVTVDIETSGHPHARKASEYYYDGHTIPFPDESFDFILCSEVLEHLFNAEEILTELNRVLVKSGSMLLTVPFVWEEHEIPYDFARYTSAGLCDLVRRHGFEVVSIRRSTRYIETVFQMGVAYLSQRRLFLHLKPLRLLCTPILFAPILIIGKLFSAILPDDPRFYHNNILIVRK